MEPSPATGHVVSLHLSSLSALSGYRRYLYTRAPVHSEETHTRPVSSGNSFHHFRLSTLLLLAHFQQTPSGSDKAVTTQYITLGPRPSRPWHPTLGPLSSVHSPYCRTATHLDQESRYFQASISIPTSAFRHATSNHPLFQPDRLPRSPHVCTIPFAGVFRGGDTNIQELTSPCSAWSAANLRNAANLS